MVADVKTFIKSITPSSVLEARQAALRKIRSRRMLSETRYRIPFTRTKVAGDDYFVPYYAKNRQVGRTILSGAYYEPETHRLVAELQRIRPGNMIHAGTSFGDMLPSFSRACPRTLFAFEPVLESYIMAKLCVQQNDLGNVILLNAALGSELSAGFMDVATRDGTHRGGKSSVAQKGQPTAILAIDQFDLADLSLIQLDLEGHEREALRGASRTISQGRPYVLIEDNLETCADDLAELGYSRAGRIPNLALWADDTHLAHASRILTDLGFPT